MFKCDVYIQIAADSISALRASDVHRVLEGASQHRRKVANYIQKHRPDLTDEVNECLTEIRQSEKAAKRW
jgi:hypothetical protein